MSVWKSIKAWAVETMNESSIENIRALEQAKQEELRKARREAEQPKKTDMERILDAMKASMHEEGRWVLYRDKREVCFEEQVYKGEMWIEEYKLRLVDEKTGWGVVTRSELCESISGIGSERYLRTDRRTQEETQKVGVMDGGLQYYIDFNCPVGTLAGNTLVPEKQQLMDLLHYWNDNISKPLREAERKAKEKQEIGVLKQMYLVQEK